FLEAEDGIRDRTVTGVQTCALPISSEKPRACSGTYFERTLEKDGNATDSPTPRRRRIANNRAKPRTRPVAAVAADQRRKPRPRKIGRASCREREQKTEGSVAEQDDR